MKNILLILVILTGTIFLSGSVSAQVEGSSQTVDTASQKIYIIKKNDGAVYIGKILKQDAKEVLIETKELGQIVIPKHEIKEIREMKQGEMNNKGDFIGRELFASRYSLTMNALPMEKGETYIQWSWYGPDFQFSLGSNMSFGVATTWAAYPVVLSTKYSFRLAQKVHLALGLYGGTGSWHEPKLGMAYPFAAVTMGSRKSNVNIGAGYGVIFSEYSDPSKGAILNIGAMTKVGAKVSLVFEGVFAPMNTFSGGSGLGEGFIALNPGIRLQTKEERAFQFGFAAFKGTGKNQEFYPFPIPMIHLFQKL